MGYSITSDYRSGMPQTRKNALPYRLIACHDTEGGTGRSGALGTLNYLVSVASSRNASYHELWYYAEATDEFGVIRIVPPGSCSHSLNPNPPPGGSYEPDAWVRASLGDGWRDPNQGVYAVSIAGRVADVERYAANPLFVGHALRRIGEIRNEIPGLEGLAEHFRFNPSTRSDWGKSLTPKLGGLAFTTTLPDTSVEDDMLDPDKYAPVASVVFRGGTIYKDPGRSAAFVNLAAPTRLQVFALPRSATDGTKAALVPVLIDVQGGPGADYEYGWAGVDQIDPASWQPIGWTSGSQADYDAAVAKVEEQAQRIALKDAYIAQYPKG